MLAVFYGNSMSRCSNVDPMRNFKMTSTCAGKIFFILWVPVFGIYHKLWAPISESLRILAVTILSLCKIWDLQALGQSSCRNSNTKQHLHKGTWKHHIVIQNFTKTQSCDQSLPAQPISNCKAVKKKKPTYLCAPHEFLKTMCLPCLIIIKSCYGIDKPFACSHCMMYISCSVHLISTYYAHKGSLAFFIFNYPQIKVGKSNYMGNII